MNKEFKNIVENKLELTLPVTYHLEFVDDKEYHIITSNDETRKLLNIPIVVQADSKEEAIRKFWVIVNIHLDYMAKRSHQADKWEPLRIGPWKKYGKWFTLFGHTFSFRYGKQNKGGWFVPFTKLNISYSNKWKQAK